MQTDKDNKLDKLFNDDNYLKWLDEPKIVSLIASIINMMLGEADPLFKIDHLEEYKLIRIKRSRLPSMKRKLIIHRVESAKSLTLQLDKQLMEAYHKGFDDNKPKRRRYL